MTGDEIGAMLGPIEAEMTKLRDTPCRYHVERGEQLCLEPHAGEGPAWRDLKPERMDEGCRAYWHLSMAADTLRRWRSNVLATEADAARATR